MWVETFGRGRSSLISSTFDTPRELARRADNLRSFLKTMRPVEYGTPDETDSESERSVLAHRRSALVRGAYVLEIS
jgi:hypothetical protein